jgi:hypothetical protein
VHMQKSLLQFSLIFFGFVFFASCTKFDSTSIGDELIPEVDNVNTFADTLDVISIQDSFAGNFKDSSVLSLNDSYALGKLADPSPLGLTNANLYLQLKPAFYPYVVGTYGRDSIVETDSVVLCLGYKSFYGDTLTPLQLQVFEVGQNAGNWDSLGKLNNINFAPPVNIGAPLSELKSFDLRQLGNYVKVGLKDSAKNQIRIKLSNDFKNRLFGFDTSATTTNNAFRSDSIFRSKFNGFAVMVQQGNALAYIGLTDANTRLELHYKKRTRPAVDSPYVVTKDSVYSSFSFNTTTIGSVRRSQVANNIIRSRGALPDGSQEIYIQTSPGTFATLEIPALTNYSNRIVHRAELQIQQIPDLSSDKIFTEPINLYLDLVDTGTNRWKPVYFDLNPSYLYDPDNQTSGYPYFPFVGGVDVNYFGGNLRKKVGPVGEQSYYNFNLTRYVQQLVTKKTRNHKLRVYAPFNFSYPQYGSNVISYYNPIAYGRVKVGGGSNANPAYRMRLRVVYSNIK